MTPSICPTEDTEECRSSWFPYVCWPGGLDCWKSRSSSDTNVKDSWHWIPAHRLTKHQIWELRGRMREWADQHCISGSFSIRRSDLKIGREFLQGQGNVGFFLCSGTSGLWSNEASRRPPSQLRDASVHPISHLRVVLVPQSTFTW